MRTFYLFAIAIFSLATGAAAGPFDKSNQLCLTSDPGDCTMVAEYADGTPRTLREIFLMFEETSRAGSMIRYYQNVTIEHVRCVNNWAEDEVDWDTLVPIGKRWRDGTLGCS